MICLTDSSAAKGIESRKGVGKVKHLSLKELWVQDAIEQTRFKVQKVGTDSTWADLGTKVLDGSRILQLLKLLRLKGGAVIASVVTLQQLKERGYLRLCCKRCVVKVRTLRFPMFQH